MNKWHFHHVLTMYLTDVPNKCMWDILAKLEILSSKWIWLPAIDGQKSINPCHELTSGTVEMPF